jgi:hypothetical protein
MYWQKVKSKPKRVQEHFHGFSLPATPIAGCFRVLNEVPHSSSSLELIALKLLKCKSGLREMKSELRLANQ